MGIRFYQQPGLKEPDLIAAWPGIGNIGLVAVDTLRKAVKAEPFAEVDPWHFFYPHGVSIQDGELKEMRFPRCRFFFKKFAHRDSVFFVGEEQPVGGRKGYEMANLILDMASLLGCKRIYTAAAAVTPIHHTSKPRVWTVPNSKDLVEEIRQYPNAVLMSDIEGRGGEGSITGLNGLLLGVAKKRGIKGICLLGEMPVYISQIITPYPRASRSIIEILCHILGVEVDLSQLDEMSLEVEGNIRKFYEMIPEEMRERIDHLKYVDHLREEEQSHITEEDKKRIMQDIEEFFKKGGKED